MTGSVHERVYSHIRYRASTLPVPGALFEYVHGETTGVLHHRFAWVRAMRRRLWAGRW